MKKNQSNDSCTVESVSKLDYLDAVLNEVYRRWCPMPQIQRTCIEPVTIKTIAGNSLQLTVGDTVVIPSYAIHMNAAFYKNPEKFDPERFNQHNRHTIRTEAFLPFGDKTGESRICANFPAFLFHIS